MNVYRSAEFDIRYEKREVIGGGGFGKIYKGVDTHTETTVAIKTIELEDAEDELENIHSEIAIMSEAKDCPQLVQLIGSQVVNSELWIIMEYLDGGSLADVMKSTGPFDEQSVSYIMMQLLKALNYLHCDRKIHRDVKAANILTNSSGVVKLADFGATSQLTESISNRKTIIGTAFWMAPEVISTQDGYNICADIWSTGITAIELLLGAPPHFTSSVDPIRIIVVIASQKEPPALEGSQFSSDAKDFVRNCLTKDPSQRPTAAKLLHHPFLRRGGSAAQKIAVESNNVPQLVSSPASVVSLLSSGGGGGGGGGGERSAASAVEEAATKFIQAISSLGALTTHHHQPAASHIVTDQLIDYGSPQQFLNKIAAHMQQLSARQRPDIPVLKVNSASAAMITSSDAWEFGSSNSRPNSCRFSNRSRNDSHCSNGSGSGTSSLNCSSQDLLGDSSATLVVSDTRLSHRRLRKLGEKEATICVRSPADLQFYSSHPQHKALSRARSDSAGSLDSNASDKSDDTVNSTLKHGGGSGASGGQDNNQRLMEFFSAPTVVAPPVLCLSPQVIKTSPAVPITPAAWTSLNTCSSDDSNDMDGGMIMSLDNEDFMRLGFASPRSAVSPLPTLVEHAEEQLDEPIVSTGGLSLSVMPVSGARPSLASPDQGLFRFHSVLKVLKRYATSPTAASRASSASAQTSGGNNRHLSTVFERIIRPALQLATNLSTNMDYCPQDFDQSHCASSPNHDHSDGDDEDSDDDDAADTARNRAETHALEVQDIVTVLVGALTALDLHTGGELSNDFALMIASLVIEETSEVAEDGEVGTSITCD